MIRMFDEMPEERTTERGKEFGDEVKRLLKPLIIEAQGLGFSLRDIQMVIDEEVRDIITDRRFNLGDI